MIKMFLDFCFFFWFLDFLGFLDGPDGSPRQVVVVPGGSGASGVLWKSTIFLGSSSESSSWNTGPLFEDQSDGPSLECHPDLTTRPTTVFHFSLSLGSSNVIRHSFLEFRFPFGFYVSIHSRVQESVHLECQKNTLTQFVCQVGLEPVTSVLIPSRDPLSYHCISLPLSILHVIR